MVPNKNQVLVCKSIGSRLSTLPDLISNGNKGGNKKKVRLRKNVKQVTPDKAGCQQGWKDIMKLTLND